MKRKPSTDNLAPAFAPTPTRCLTIDVEEYFHIEAARSVAPRRDWDRWPSRVLPQMDHLLQLLADHGVRATLFVLGWIAQRHGPAVRRWAQLGHEIASHGMFHDRLTTQSPDVVLRHLRQSRRLLEDVAGQAVLGFRAPTWSITPRNFDMLQLVRDAGYRYDASIFPIRHPQYGIPNAPIVPWQPFANDTFRELPPLVRQIGRRRCPAAGGAYLRHLPLTWTAQALRQATRQQRPAVLYVHPWEFDADLPRLPLNLLQHRRTYAGLNRNTGKLQKLLTAFDGWRLLADTLPTAPPCALAA